MFIFRKNGHFYEKIGKKGEAVCIDDKIPFEVPDNWELCRLENLCSLLNPKIGENGQYPYLNAKFLRNKTDPEIKEKGRFIQTNTKVILVDGENSGEVFLTHTDGYMGSTFRLLDINSQIYDKYILKLIELWRNPLKKSKKGAAIPHLNKEIFNNIIVGIPPLNEQKRIVNQIDSLMPLIIDYGDYEEKLDKLNSEFPDKLKSSILQEAIQGKLVPQDPNDEPASVLLEKIKEEKERLIKEKKIKRNKNESYIFKENNHFYERIGKKGEEVCIDDEISFDVPTNWELCRLENLCSLLNPKIGENGQYPYLNAKFLRNKTDPEIKEKGRFIQTNTKVILVDGENSGEVFLTHTDGYMGSTFRLLDINSQIYDKYILKLIELWRNPLKKSKKGAAIPHLNKEIFNNIIVGIPPLNEQKRIVDKIEELLEILDN